MSIPSLEALLSNKDELISSIKDDLLLLQNKNNITTTGNDAEDDLNVSKMDKTPDVNTILTKETQLATELHDLQQLKTISSLIMEFKTNFELFELENCFYSLQSLRKQIGTITINNNNPSFARQNYHFQRSVIVYIDSLHLDLISRIFEIITLKFWNITSESISFNPKLNVQTTDGLDVEIAYDSFISSIKNLYFPNDIIDSEFWIISNVELNDLHESIRNKLQTIFKDYINLDGVSAMIKNAIFTNNKQFKYANNKLSIISSLTSMNQTDFLTTTIESFQNIITFLNETLPLQDRNILLSKLGNTITTELLKFVKVNISKILNNENSNLMKDQTLKINTELITFAKHFTLSSSSHSGLNNFKNYDGQQIIELLNNNRIYYNLLLDNSLYDQIKQMRIKLANDTDPIWDIIQLHHNAQDKTSLSEDKTNTVKNNIDNDNNDDDWNWNEEEEETTHNVDGDEGDEDVDAWGDEIDLELDAENESLNKKPLNHGENDAASWNEAWDIGEDDININNETNTRRRSSTQPKVVSNIAITNLPELFSGTLKNFNTSYKEIGENNIDKESYNHKLNVLQTAFISMTMPHFQNANNWWVFYNDMKIIIKDNEEIPLTRIQELSYSYLETELNLKKKHVSKLVERQLQSLKRNENNPNWYITEDELLPYIKSEIIGPLQNINGIDSQERSLLFLNFLYNHCIINSILKWEMISDKNSEHLSHFFQIILNETHVDSLEHLHSTSKNYKELREKFKIIGNFLPLHMKEIMEMFYDGDFYLFSTEEIIEWLKLLFADTPVRKNAIDDINEIRGAALEN
ncbi:Dsl1p NDAI_0F04110 [Naumovozyma dairenensis CBS 421]|uniref:Retrograde transport protein Dsl1 C-terminal domain-containing protein n=1 Tax=Naumovozyma dairenensis (strain ATCC 10597 / BCRC 20456 / CBS 421 / NBRC 0211 / NRRL Y-12639) TaxID=1071378 RepID=G0WD68_NAUDC|nr:hypothetical protein NDAI_0F04110 [Naumovozyma dairenensis CBS 421]CCD25729.1 hypothetical protein NDAI_0F04110 [Naumovozyma dairenensis CBS 421]